MELLSGIEPLSQNYKFHVLPLNYRSMLWQGMLDSNQRCKVQSLVPLSTWLIPYIMVVTAGFEPATYGLEGHCSNPPELSDHIMVGMTGFEPAISGL